MYGACLARRTARLWPMPPMFRYKNRDICVALIAASHGGRHAYYWNYLDHHRRLCRRPGREVPSPGSNNLQGFIFTTILGIVGAFVATFIGQAIGWYGPGQGAGFIAAAVGAILVLFIWHRLVAAHVVRDPGSR
jgi:uncharacterized membrane protein YeaQ/YmgE (transglycosylase-associated protein family)